MRTYAVYFVSLMLIRRFRAVAAPPWRGAMRARKARIRRYAMRHGDNELYATHYAFMPRCLF